MADPSPPNGLPEVEYLELFNRSPEAISLGGWHLSDPGSSAVLTNITLQPGQYLAIASRPIGTNDDSGVMIVPLPSLNNTGDSLLLTDPTGRVIDAVNYNSDWYRDQQRSGGGWSLEIIDTNNICEAAENWRVSDATRGGTPGAPNSIQASNPDTNGPLLVSVQALDPVTLRILFNEKLASGTTSNDWVFSPSLQVSSGSFGDSSRTAIDLHLMETLKVGTLYSLSVASVFDCSGNRQPVLQHTSFALPERANRGDVVINEVLFNPPSDGVDFIELANASQKYIDLNGWAIGSLDENGNLDKVSVEKSVILRPGGYVAFTTDLSRLIAQYDASDSTLCQLKLPAYPDDRGGVVVLNDVAAVMDVFKYSSDMHSVFIRDPEGVSLERLSTRDSTQDRSNWTSAASSAGFGTPGKPNSASGPLISSGDDPVQVTPRVFTPFTGQPGFTEIAYRFTQSGLVGSVSICDSRGLAVRHLANNILLGTEGFLKWEGERDDGSRTQTGYYVIWFQVFSADGWSHVYRESVAVSPKY